MFIRNKPILSSERMLHKDYDHEGSVEKKRSLIMSFEGLGTKMNLWDVESGSTERQQHKFL
jgi:hypothetical protein